MSFFEKEDLPTSAMYTQGSYGYSDDDYAMDPMSESEWLRDLGVSVRTDDDQMVGAW